MFRQRVTTKLYRLIMVCIAMTIFLPCNAIAQTKIGVLLIAGGISEDYGHEWRVGFYDHLFPVWPKGFLAGGPKEGSTCYTIIHYANEAEAFICGVAEGTPIDAFCNEYTGGYPVHSLSDHYPGDGDGTFLTDCYSNVLPAVVFAGSHKTIDPITLEEIEGPHIDDPLGSGIGVADFIEIGSFGFMESLYHLPNNKSPSLRQSLKWFYGNDTPAFLAYPPDTPELTNVKDELALAMPGVDFVFRHGSEAFMKNLDAYGNPTPIPDSTETAIEELIHDENVDQIVVLSSSPGSSNLTAFGPCWRDENGQGVSAIPNKTYRECLEDLTDGFGPATQGDLDEYLTNKPVEELLKIANPEIEHLVLETDPTTDVTFARGVSEMEEFELAALDMLNYTIAKYSIPGTASLKVIIAGHGLSAGWKDVLECDNYDSLIYDAFDRIIARIESSVSWTGTFEVVGGENEMSETKYDPASQSKPFGDVWSTGEQIDAGINGTYVNELGQTIDNGTDKFDYIIVIPISWMGESTDSLGHGRAVLGNNILSSIQGQPAYERDENDGDGTHYNAGDFDSEYFTVKVFDGTGWPSIPGCIEDPDCEIHNPPVNKGVSAPDDSTVIITGTILSRGNSTARTHLVDAAVQAIIEAVQNPDIGGYGDPFCEDFTDSDGVPDDLDNCPTVYNPEQEDNYPPDGNEIGDACDCEGDFDCSGGVDATDVTTFLTDFGRSQFSNPCTDEPKCKGDFNCDLNVDAADVTVFLEDFGRSSFFNPCPACVPGTWCTY